MANLKGGELFFTHFAEYFLIKSKLKLFRDFCNFIKVGPIRTIELFSIPTLKNVRILKKFCNLQNITYRSLFYCLYDFSRVANPSVLRNFNTHVKRNLRKFIAHQEDVTEQKIRDKTERLALLDITKNGISWKREKHSTKKPKKSIDKLGNLINFDDEPLSEIVNTPHLKTSLMEPPMETVMTNEISKDIYEKVKSANIVNSVFSQEVVSYDTITELESINVSERKFSANSGAECGSPTKLPIETFIDRNLTDLAKLGRQGDEGNSKESIFGVEFTDPYNDDLESNKESESGYPTKVKVHSVLPTDIDEDVNVDIDDVTLSECNSDTYDMGESLHDILRTFAGNPSPTEVHVKLNEDFKLKCCYVACNHNTDYKITKALPKSIANHYLKKHEITLALEEIGTQCFCGAVLSFAQIASLKASHEDFVPVDNMTRLAQSLTSADTNTNATA